MESAFASRARFRSSARQSAARESNGAALGACVAVVVGAASLYAGVGGACGIDPSTYLNVLDAGQSDTARLDLLKPSKLWSVALVDLANSAPVRILFTVPLCVGA